MKIFIVTRVFFPKDKSLPLPIIRKVVAQSESYAECWFNEDDSVIDLTHKAFFPYFTVVNELEEIETIK